MDMTIRSGLLAVVAAALMACGGATDPNEALAERQSGLDGKGSTDPNKPAADDGTKPGDPDVKDPNPGGACWWDSEGSDSSCKGEDVWKQYASDACSLKGGTLTNLAFGESCDKDGQRYAKWECCTPEPKDPAPVPPKDPGTGDPSCIGEYANGVCQSETAWKDTASQTCAKLGLALTDIGFGTTCGKAGEVSEVKFTCCK